MAWLLITRAISTERWQDTWVLVGPELTATNPDSQN